MGEAGKVKEEEKKGRGRREVPEREEARGRWEGKTQERSVNKVPSLLTSGNAAILKKGS